MPAFANLPRFRRLNAAAVLLLLAAPAAASQPALQTRSDTVELSGLEIAFRDVADRVTGGVVAVTAGARAAPAVGPAAGEALTAAAVAQMLGTGPRTVGTGFCVDARGYVLTNEHVVRGARQLYVTRDDGRVFPAMIVATDPRGDLAVLKVPTRLPALEFAPPIGVRRGQWALTVGNPVGLSGGGGMCLSVGVVSAIGRDLPALSRREGRPYVNLIQTTAEVNPGNSGGPLFDLEGRVIGVVTAVVLPQGRAHGVGFAVPADADFRRRVEGLVRGEPATYGFLGVAGTDATGGGLRVTRVGDGTPADGAIEVGDVLLRVDGRAVEDEQSFVRLIGTVPADRPVPLVLRRGGEERAVVVRLRPVIEPSAVSKIDQRLRWRGVTFAPDGAGVRVAAVAADCPLPVEVGQRLTAVAGRPVADLTGLLSSLSGPDAASARLDLADAPMAAPESVALAGRPDATDGFAAVLSVRLAD